MDSDRLQPTRHLDWEMCYNVRDLGGYVTLDHQTTCWRSIVRGDNLCRLNLEGIQAALAYGVGTVIDLRSPSETIVSLHPFALHDLPKGYPVYLNLPLLKEKDRAAMSALQKADSNMDAYPLILERFKPNVGAVMRAVAAAREGAVLIHCHAGKDRTGLVAALILSLAGVPPATIMADYAESDRYLQPFYQRLLEKAPEDADKRKKFADAMLAKPEIMQHTLEYLDQEYHGVTAYLESAGVSKADQDKIRRRLVKD